MRLDRPCLSEFLVFEEMGNKREQHTSPELYMALHIVCILRSYVSFCVFQCSLMLIKPVMAARIKEISCVLLSPGCMYIGVIWYHECTMYGKS